MITYIDSFQKYLPDIYMSFVFVSHRAFFKIEEELI